MNGIVYFHYERWYKNGHRSQDIPIEVVVEDFLSVFADIPCSFPNDQSSVYLVFIVSFDVRLSTSLLIHQDDLTYASLRNLIEKLEFF